jgi:hypothetical protein
LQTYVLPAATVILILLFAIQPLGTARIGRAFGLIMLTWFLIIAALGVYGVLQHPNIWVAINPLSGLDYLMSCGFQSFLVLGGVFLCVTGSEALYADIGHFRPRPMQLAWNFIVVPSLILNYAGQAAIVLAGAPTDGNIFCRLCPGTLLTPLIVVATVATVIASQSIVTGAYSMTRQAIQLGWLPHMTIKQTSEEGYGQIHVGTVNWLLMIVTLGLTIGFGKSNNLAAAYGIAVFRDDADDERAALHRDARGLELVDPGGGRGRGSVHPHRRQLLRRQHGQGVAWRLGPAAARRHRLWGDVGLASRRGRGPEECGVGGDADFGADPAAELGEDRARAGLRRVLHTIQGSGPPDHVVVRAPQRLAARTHAGADDDRALDFPGRSGRAVDAQT